MTTGIAPAFCNHASRICRHQIIKFRVFRVTFRTDYISHDISITLPGKGLTYNSAFGSI
ncbi:MAG: hypothetical protein PHD71_08065 [Methanospirillum sp.]|nr:hypothetical protein [Methanospirillum sp.]